MAASPAKIRCAILTPQAPIVEESVFDIVLPAHDGLLGVLPGHAPMLCNLGAGLLTYHNKDMHRRTYYIEGGLGHIRDNEVTIMTSKAISSTEICQADAEEMLLEARIMPMSTLEEVEARRAAMQQAQHMVALSKGGF